MTQLNQYLRISVDVMNKIRITVKGEFALPFGTKGLPEAPTEVLKHIVLVVTRSGNYQSVTPFQNVVVFPDDVKVKEDICSGFFNINVMDHIAFDGEGDYYLSCSVGTILSNTMLCTL